MKQESSKYLDDNAKVKKAGGTIKVRVTAPLYKNKHTDQLVWISTEDVVSWLATNGHKIKTVEESGHVRNRYSDQDVTWVFSVKNKTLKKNSSSVKVKPWSDTKDS